MNLKNFILHLFILIFNNIMIQYNFEILVLYNYYYTIIIYLHIYDIFI